MILPDILPELQIQATESALKTVKAAENILEHCTEWDYNPQNDVRVMIQEGLKEFRITNKLDK